MVNSVKLRKFALWQLSFYVIIMIGDIGMNRDNSFDSVIRYKLYRSVYEIIHPSISKMNVSNYAIVINDNFMPVRVFYPNKVSDIKKVIIYIHGISSITNCSNYADICQRLAIDTKQIVIALDYEQLDTTNYLKVLEECYKLVEFLIKDLIRLRIKQDDITLIGDSVGATIVSSLGMLFKDKKSRYNIKEVLFYPILSGEYNGKSKFESIDKNNLLDKNVISSINEYYDNNLKYKKDHKNKLVFPLLEKKIKTLPKTLIIVGNIDPLRDENIYYYQELEKNNSDSELLELPFLGHGFLNKIDNESYSELLEKLIEFVK